MPKAKKVKKRILDTFWPYVQDTKGKQEDIIYVSNPKGGCISALADKTIIIPAVIKSKRKDAVDGFSYGRYRYMWTKPSEIGSWRTALRAQVLYMMGSTNLDSTDWDALSNLAMRMPIEYDPTFDIFVGQVHGESFSHAVFVIRDPLNKQYCLFNPNEAGRAKDVLTEQIHTTLKKLLKAPIERMFYNRTGEWNAIGDGLCNVYALCYVLQWKHMLKFNEVKGDAYKKWIEAFKESVHNWTDETLLRVLNHYMCIQNKNIF